MKLYYHQDMFGNIYTNKFDHRHIYTDINGNPVHRTKETYPYAYDPYVVWKDDYNENTDGATYSDRLWQQNPNKFDECRQKVWNDKGQIFSYRDSIGIEKFLSLYFEREVKLTAIIEGCNSSNGYPYWVFFYRDIKGDK